LLGGSGNDIANAISVDTLGLAYVTGGTASIDFPVLSALQSIKAAGQDAFVTKLAAAGNQLFYSTFLGGSGGLLGSPEHGADIAVDSSGYAYIAGTTSSSDFPVSGFQGQSGGGSTDAFVAKLGTSGNTLVYSTYFGGSGSDYAAGLVLRAGKAILAGHTSSPNLPLQSAVQPTNGGLNDAFVARFGVTGAALEFSSYFGGSHTDGATGVATDSVGGMILAGVTQSADLPTDGPLQVSNAGVIDSFVTRFADYMPQTPAAVSVSPSSGSSLSQDFQFTYSDGNGYQEMGWAHAMFQTAVTQVSACYVQYLQGSDSLWLRNDEGTTWLGPVTPGQAGSLQNSQCIVDGAISSVSVSGNALILNLAVTFQSGFVGTKNIYMFVADTASLNSGWQQRGTWNTQDAYAPAAASVSPSSGSGSSETFQFAYSDDNGSQQMGWVHALLQTSLNQLSACYIQYLQGSDSLWLRNDAGTAWLGPLTPGQAGSLQNSQCIVDGAASSVSGSGDTLTLDLALAFQQMFAGTKNIYMYVADTSGMNSGWQQRGNWNTEDVYPPESVSVAPSSGSGSSQTFQFAYSDGNGYQQMGWAHAMFQTSVNQANACYIQYLQGSDALWLRDDTGTAWLGPINPGQPGSLQNSQCTLDGQASSVSGSGDTLTLDLAFAFQPAFAGLKNVYMYVADTSGLHSGWNTRGTWITEDSQAPEAVSVAPSSGSGASQTFAFSYSDANGHQQMGWVHAMLQTSVDEANACHVQYLQGSDSLWLHDDAGTAWLGPITPGKSGSLQNSQCTLDGQASSVAGSRDTLTLNLTFTFHQAFASQKNVYMYVADTSGLNSGWSARGMWITEDPQAPESVSVTPSSGSGATQTFAFTYSDANGYRQMGWVHAMFQTSVNQASACYIQYLQGSDSLWLRSDTGTTWLGPITPGQSGSLQNSQCILDGQATSASGSGDTLTLNLAFTFQQAFAGTKNVYMYVADTSGLLTDIPTCLLRRERLPADGLGARDVPDQREPDECLLHPVPAGQQLPLVARRHRNCVDRAHHPRAVRVTPERAMHVGRPGLVALHRRRYADAEPRLHISPGVRRDQERLHVCGRHFRAELRLGSQRRLDAISSPLGRKLILWRSSWRVSTAYSRALRAVWVPCSPPNSADGESTCCS